MATMREDETIRFLGRYKDMLKVGGENVDPIEVEALLLQHPAVHQAKVVGVPDARLREVACACVIPAPGAQVAPEALIADCQL
jgi:fatty-acyl-CoA synthase